MTATHRGLGFLDQTVSDNSLTPFPKDIFTALSVDLSFLPLYSADSLSRQLYNASLEKHLERVIRTAENGYMPQSQAKDILAWLDRAKKYKYLYDNNST